MSKPTMPCGYLGPQEKWEAMGLSTVTHNSPDIRCHTCRLEIKFKTTKPTKVTAVLLDANSDEKYPELVFTQTVQELVYLVIAFPAAGFFKLQVHALPAEDESLSLPNIYNYLIQNTVPPSGPVTPFPKQFAQWKDGCYLFEPFCLKGMDAAQIKVIVPGARAVALTINEEWFPLKQRPSTGKDDVKHRPWSGHLEGLSKFKGKAEKAVLTANFDEKDETKYTSLLSYNM